MTETGRGRPRDEGLDAAIFDATLQLLLEVGYERLSIEAVASRAGVGKATIYRRHPDKPALVAAAVDRRGPWRPPVAGSGTPRDELLTLVGWVAQEISGQQIGLLGALFAGMRSDPGLAAGVRDVLRRDQSALMQAWDLVAGAPGTPLAEVATALVVHRVVVVGQPCDAPFVAHVVDDVLLPLMNSNPRRRDQ